MTEGTTSRANNVTTDLNDDATNNLNNDQANDNDINELRILQANLHENRERTRGILNDPDVTNYTILLQEQF
jgi:hypothetical protein